KTLVLNFLNNGVAWRRGPAIGDCDPVHAFTFPNDVILEQLEHLECGTLVSESIISLTVHCPNLKHLVLHVVERDWEEVMDPFLKSIPKLETLHFHSYFVEDIVLYLQ